MTPAQRQLKQVIDAIGLKDTLYNLAAFCFARADRLRSSWRDEKTAQLWDSIGDQISQLSSPPGQATCRPPRRRAGEPLTTLRYPSRR
jgi:hypothetical protein